MPTRHLSIQNIHRMQQHVANHVTHTKKDTTHLPSKYNSFIHETKSTSIEYHDGIQALHGNATCVF
jgi:hypothetical protein